jgi:hypothetical protein
MEMEMNDINNLIFDYVISLIKRYNYDIYNISEDQYDMYICDDLHDNIVNKWMAYRYFRIGESKFKPSINALTYMVEDIIQYREEEGNETSTEILNSLKDKYDILHNYAYYYIYYMGYEQFLSELKKHLTN